LTKGDLEKAERGAILAIQAGFSSHQEVVDHVLDIISTEDRCSPTGVEIIRIVTRIWNEQLLRQEEWPEVADADRVAHAFAAL
jgi:hypothetical protein